MQKLPTEESHSVSHASLEISRCQTLGEGDYTPHRETGKGDGEANSICHVSGVQSVSKCTVIATTHWTLYAARFTLIISFNPHKTIKIGVIISILQNVDERRNRPHWQNQDLGPMFVRLQSQLFFYCIILLYLTIKPHTCSVKWTASSMQVGPEYLSCWPLQLVIKK